MTSYTPRGNWSDMTREQRIGVIVTGVLQAVLVTLMQIDISRRPAHSLRLNKQVWRAASIFQPFGPIAYFVVERSGLLPKRATEQSSIG